ncbi:MAG: hypothetical protein HYW01_11340 [Deltaproteobacteria bacterium]|nr:hypothetical protein [Deltaproteobacteria bacterium]
MKRLITIATLSLALSLPALSFASDYMGLYTKPVVRIEVKDEIKGGNVEKDFTSFYLSPKTANTPATLTTGQMSDDENISVFGVQIPLGPRA